MPNVSDKEEEERERERERERGERERGPEIRFLGMACKLGRKTSCSSEVESFDKSDLAFDHLGAIESHVRSTSVPKLTPVSCNVPQDQLKYLDSKAQGCLTPGDGPSDLVQHN